MNVFFCGGDCAEDIQSHLSKDLKSIPGNFVPSADILSDLSKLHDLRLGELKFLELQDKKNAQEREAQNLERQAKEQKIERYIKYGVEGAGIILPIGFYWIWMNRGFKFEEVGTYTSQTFKSLYGKFKIK
jgi:hypothetical protein